MSDKERAQAPDRTQRRRSQSPAFARRSYVRVERSPSGRRFDSLRIDKKDKEHDE